MSVPQVPTPIEGDDLSAQGLVLIYRRLIAVGAACIVAGTALWEFPFPRSQLYQGGFFLVVSGFVVFGLVIVLEGLSNLTWNHGTARWLSTAFFVSAVIVLLVTSVISLAAGASALTDLRVCIFEAEKTLCVKKFHEYTDAERDELARTRAIW